MNISSRPPVRPPVRPWIRNTPWIALGLLSCALVARVATSAVETTTPPVALRENTPRVQAFTNARLVIAPGRTIEKGTLIARDGVIAAVGASVSVPKDAVVIDLAGATIYPGLFDPLVELETPPPASGGRTGAATRGSGAGATGATGAGTRGPAYWNPFVTPELQIEREVLPDSATVRKLRDQGVTTIAAAPSRGVVKGTGAVLTLADEPLNQRLLKSEAALHVGFEPPATWRDGGYPNSPMGAYTLVRQAFFDADWYGKARGAWTKNPTKPRPETNAALEALSGFTAQKRPVIIKTNTELDVLRADRIGKELGLAVVVRGSGREYRRLDEVKATGRAIIVPVAFPKPPLVDTPEQALNASLESLMHWDLAPENAGRLANAGVLIALTSDRLEDRGEFLSYVRRAVERGLTKEDALRALTTTPAGLYGVSDRLGTLESGKLAHLVVTDGDLFSKKTRVREVWIDGERYDVKRRADVDARGRWVLAADPKPPTGAGSPGATAGDSLVLLLEGQPDSLSGTMRRGSPEKMSTAKLKNAGLLERRIFVTAPGESLGIAKGFVRFTATVEGDRLVAGTGEYSDGTPFTLTGQRVAAFRAAPDTARAKSQAASYAVNYPLGEAGREAPPVQPDVVAFTGATVWTSGPKGRIENGTVIVRKGKISSVGTDLAVPSGAVVVDARGKHITSGLIDCHSHTASDGGINEGGQTVTAEVRIADYVDPNDEDIYRELAGGLTAAHVLHGSANTIGGQCQLIKLRWGMGPEAMKFAGAPPTIKFALGENVKQSNWDGGSTGRYPQTRMGVEQLLRDEFQAAREYDAAWKRGGTNGMPPRRDLELEALAEVLRGERTIHWHSYRQDEILMAMKVCDDFGIPAGTFQHILEGYKVSDEMARRKWGGSSFSDWWAYKMEVTDAIPYNGALMNKAGVVVSFNSDSNELARRLNTEAGKAVKYGGVSEEEALRFVTINPAKQLKVESKVGSIEPGKDADLVVWSGPPLSTLSRCEETWIDGRKFFDRAEDLSRRTVEARMRATLIQKALSDPEAGKGSGERRRPVAMDLIDGHDHEEDPGPDACDQRGVR